MVIEVDRKEAILLKIKSIEEELPDSMESLGLYTGNAGKALFYCYLSDYLKTNQYNDKIEKALLCVFEEINRGHLDTTFCSGIAGVIWCVEHLKKQNLLDFEDDFKSIYDSLKESALHFSKVNCLDFLHGADGIIYSLLAVDGADEYLIQNWLELLQHHAHKETDGYVWETILDVKGKDKVLNLSLSHGLSSKIIVLAETVKKYPENKLARTLVEGCVTYLLQVKNPDHEMCCFPTHADTRNGGMHSRLAWCYGDLGNAIALWRAGTLLENKGWKQQAVETMIKAAKRKDCKQEGVRDAGFCHGSAGIAHIFNRFYWETGREEFDEARWYWIHKTLEFGNKPGGIGGYKRFAGEDTPEYVTEANFLEGATGIALVLLGFLAERKENIAWDACFLMN